jgi:hypothetical protein
LLTFVCRAECGAMAGERLMVFCWQWGTRTFARQTNNAGTAALSRKRMKLLWCLWTLMAWKCRSKVPMFYFEQFWVRFDASIFFEPELYRNHHES